MHVKARNYSVHFKWDKGDMNKIIIVGLHLNFGKQYGLGRPTKTHFRIYPMNLFVMLISPSSSSSKQPCLVFKTPRPDFNDCHDTHIKVY